MQSFTISIDIPPRILSPNAARGGHWSGKNNAVKVQRTQGWALAQEQIGAKSIKTPWKKARAELCWYAARECWIPDAANTLGSTKALVDGVCDALGLNDKYLEWGRIMRAVDPESPMVVLLFEEME